MVTGRHPRRPFLICGVILFLRFVAPPAVQTCRVNIPATPDNHLSSRPYRFVNLSSARRVVNRRRLPHVRAWVVSRSDPIVWCAAPNYHFGPGPDACVSVAAQWCASRRHRLPRIGRRVVSRSRIQPHVAVVSTPDDHLSASPDCGVRSPRGRRARCRNGCPGIR